MSDEG
jgi:hypothetical protein